MKNVVKSDRTVEELNVCARAALADVGATTQASAFAPGRVNLIGDHTDYNGGLAFPAALDLGCVAAMAWDDEPGIHGIAADLGETDHAPFDAGLLDANLNGVKAWMRYVAGVIALGREHLAIDPGRGIRCAIASSVPIGSGLSSSAAVEVAVATALEALVGESVELLEKAKWCQAAEHRFAGTPCGLLDQLSSIHGEAGKALVIDFSTLSVRSVALPSADEARFVLLDSSVKHANSSGDYAARRSACERVSTTLGVEHLGLTTLERLDAARDGLSPEDYRIARHVVTETDRVRRFEDACLRSDLGTMGVLMVEAHRSMSEDFGASHPTVDRMVEIASDQDGVFGARMTGGGFGGFIIALVGATGVPSTVERLRSTIHREVGVDPEPRIINPGGGARVLAAGS